MKLAVGDMEESGNVALQVEKGMKLDAFVLRKWAHGNTDKHKSMVEESSA